MRVALIYPDVGRFTKIGSNPGNTPVADPLDSNNGQGNITIFAPSTDWARLGSLVIGQRRYSRPGQQPAYLGRDCTTLTC